jgi:hypothetical protein
VGGTLSRTERNLLQRFWQLQNVPDLLPVHHFFRAVASAVQPLRKVFQPHFVIDGDVHDTDFDRVESVGNSHHPAVAAHRRKPQGHGLIQGRGGDLNRMSYALHVRDRDAA